MMYAVAPKNFKPRFEIVSCFMECDGKILLLHRHEGKSQSGRWGLPAGKVEVGESLSAAAAREIQEETGLDVEAESLAYFGKTFHRHGDYDFVFHMFSTKLDDLPRVTINSYEHKEYQWVTPLDLLKMDKESIVEDLDEVCRLFYKLT